MARYRTTPLPTSGMPPGIGCIVGNEAAERFSYYGLKAILVVFMTRFMLDAAGQPAVFNETEARVWFHNWSAACYLFPILGALLSDGFLGKYRTIFWLSLVYCLGHVALFLNLTSGGLFLGLGLIALGTGGIKPCVSAHVGDQFGAANQQLLPRVFGWFYFSINFGAFFSTMLTPWLLEGFCEKFGLDPRWGPHLAFGVPGFLMLVATVVFWAGRKRYAHIPADAPSFWKELRSKEGLGSLLRLAGLFVFVAVFWSLYDQTFSSWILQAEKMDRHVLGFELRSGQTQAINPLLILLFVPLFSYVIYPLLGRFFTVTPLRKMGIGFALTAVSFLSPAWIEHQLQQGVALNVCWEMPCYVLLTADEDLVWITE